MSVHPEGNSLQLMPASAILNILVTIVDKRHALMLHPTVHLFVLATVSALRTIHARAQLDTRATIAVFICLVKRIQLEVTLMVSWEMTTI